VVFEKQLEAVEGSLRNESVNGLLEEREHLSATLTGRVTHLPARVPKTLQQM